ncbi:hypothetical protein YPPY03_2938, partial [Yersinia pestis PY-03]
MRVINKFIFIHQA